MRATGLAWSPPPAVAPSHVPYVIKLACNANDIASPHNSPPTINDALGEMNNQPLSVRVVELSGSGGAVTAAAAQETGASVYCSSTPIPGSSGQEMRVPE